jgi:hypothetical protein
MDPANIFVLFISALAIGILAFLELKSRRNKAAGAYENPETQEVEKGPPRKASGRQ